MSVDVIVLVGRRNDDKLAPSLRHEENDDAVDRVELLFPHCRPLLDVERHEKLIRPEFREPDTSSGRTGGFRVARLDEIRTPRRDRERRVDDQSAMIGPDRFPGGLVDREEILTAEFEGNGTAGGVIPPGIRTSPKVGMARAFFDRAAQQKMSLSSEKAPIVLPFLAAAPELLGETHRRRPSVRRSANICPGRRRRRGCRRRTNCHNLWVC